MGTGRRKTILWWEGTLIARLPSDACPYTRPFPKTFVECPLYDGQRYLPADSREKPLMPIWMCSYLVTRIFARDGIEHHYGACQFGGRGARRRRTLVNDVKRLLPWI